MQQQHLDSLQQQLEETQGAHLLDYLLYSVPVVVVVFTGSSCIQSARSDAISLTSEEHLARETSKMEARFQDMDAAMLEMKAKIALYSVKLENMGIDSGTQQPGSARPEKNCLLMFRYSVVPETLDKFEVSVTDKENNLRLREDIQV